MRQGLRIAAMDRRARLALLVLVASLVASMPDKCDAQELSRRDWINVRVIPIRRDCKLLKGPDDPYGDIMINLHFVSKIKGSSLLVNSRDGEIWVDADQVVPINKAVKYFSDAIRANPRDPFNYIMRAKLLRDELKDLDNALADFNEAIRLDPKDAAVYRNRADIWGEKKDIDKAVADYTEAIKLNPKDACSYVCRGEWWGAKKDHDKALADLNEAIRLDPKDDGSFDIRGRIWLCKKEYDKAIADYNEAIRLDRRDTQTSASHDAPKGGIPMFDRDDLDDHLVRHEHDLAKAYLARGEDRRHQKDYDKAIADFTEAVRIDPRHAVAYSLRGQAWRDRNECDKALTDLNEAIRLDPKNVADYALRGSVWLVAKRYGKAIADYTEAIRLDPKNASIHVWRGVVWLEDKEYDKAIADQTEAIHLDPQSVVAYLWRGDTLSKKKEYDKAIVDYDRAMEIDPQIAATGTGRAWIWATAPDAKYRDGKKAVEAATRACELSHSRKAHALDALAAACAEVGDFDAALKWEAKAIDLETDEDDKGDYTARLKLYQERKPYRETKP